MLRVQVESVTVFEVACGTLNSTKLVSEGRKAEKFQPCMRCIHVNRQVL